MKSAFELALERSGGDLHEYSQEEKAQLAAINADCDARAAQARFDAERRLADASDDAGRAQIRADLEVELAAIEKQRDDRKAVLRNDKDEGSDPEQSQP
jgi:hypothetical protein